MSDIQLLHVFQALQKIDLYTATFELVQVGSLMFIMFTLVTFRSWRQTCKTGIEIVRYPT